MTGIRHCIVDTPIGQLWLYSSATGLCYIGFGPNDQPASLATSVPDALAYPEASEQIQRYFAGQLRDFELRVDVPTEGFHARVQRALTRIEFGTTVSYQQLARLAGNARASRAAGSACARNQLPIVWPCHRVIRADGQVGHYRGGQAAKKWLLAAERRNFSPLTGV